MTEPRIFDFPAGEVLLIDKPLEWTSFDAVNKIRWLIRQKYKIKLKVGHAGTLDPLATGLLIICTGKFTKRIDEFQAQEKEYTGTFVIGATTPSFDLEHEIDQRYPVAHITDELIRETAVKLTGDIEQIPPMFSAIKVDGKRAYKSARKGEETIMPARQVNVREFEITRIERKEETIEIDFRISCSKGTYIRSLARDFGTELNSGAYLSALRRTRIGNFKVEDAMTIEGFNLLIG